MLEVGWWGSLGDISKNILKQGVGKAEVVLRREGDLKVSLPLPPTENFNHTPGVELPFNRVSSVTFCLSF